MNTPARYADYLQSPAWKARARAARDRAGHKCQLCGAHNKPLEVHHNDYTRRGREDAGDLICLCADCHGLHHAAQRWPWLFGLLVWVSEHLPRL